MDAKMLEKAKPILFSTAMVQAILDGRKTQTRRVIKPQTVTHSTGEGLKVENLSDFMERNRRDFDLLVAACAPFQPGDILWVRETWVKWENGLYYYKADPTPEDKRIRDCVKWKPSIHMPREAARLFLRLTGVRAERLQDICEADAQAEGVGILPSWAECGIYRRGFETLWDSLNAKRGGGIYAWDCNPWVWVYTFERIEKEG